MMDPTPSANAVRPEGATPRTVLAQALGNMRQLVGGDRSELLYQALVREIRSIPSLQGKPIRLLDYGCGMMGFSSRLVREGIISDFIGMDIYPAPAAPDSPLWRHYRQLPATGLAEVEGTFDLAIVTDVLHHADVSTRAEILHHLTRLCGLVLVKDHFEHGPLSRQLLRLADWYGNYAYGVNVPDRYFDTQTWQALVEQAGLTQYHLTPNVQVHRGLFNVILPPRHHFMALLGRAVP